ncbi:MAG: hypothetical protein WCL50_03135 [Spirochaetota bacterium]
MPRKLYYSWLDDETRITVEFLRTKKEIFSFMIKLEVLRGGKMAIKAKKLTADDVEAFLLAEGFREVTKEELRTP